MSVEPGQFAEYFNALHGHSPFPWQSRLLKTIVEDKWPKTLALPTASGKTACIDIALFALACGAENAPRRIFFVVDRRVIVDEAFSRAQRIARALAKPEKAILRQVANALSQADDVDPVAVFQLRGGVYRDDAWARTPTQPTVICSTVDQIGSRLLFRSYGSSPYNWPLHAGLVANDSLILLDEAHCANPFRQTLDAVARYRDWAERPVRAPFAHVVLSATPGALTEEPFSLHEDDHADRELSKRLSVGKPARLIECRKERTGTEAFARRLVDEARNFAAQGAKRIGIFVNRVATARHAFRMLDVPVGQKALFIGRMRPLDRDVLMARWQPVFRARSTEVIEQACFAVATQCLEVGADLDFDALVTECASLDALRQRFGRLFRLGKSSSSSADPAFGAAAVVLMPAPEASKGEQRDDPIYGESLAATWDWLNSNAQEGLFDFGINAVERQLPDTAVQRAAMLVEKRLVPPAPDAPVMLPAHVDCWAQTSPTPLPEPEPALFLHGPRDTPPDVQVCWRSDLDDADPRHWLTIVALLPPSSSECMSVPLHLVRRWLEGEDPQVTLADVDAEIEPDEKEQVEATVTPRQAVIWRGEERSALTSTDSGAAALRPGDTLVLPTSAEGWEIFGAVLTTADGRPLQADCGEEANLRARVRSVLRLHPAVLAHWPEGEARTSLQALASADNLQELVQDPEFSESLGSHFLALAESVASLPTEQHARWLWLEVTARHLSRGRFDVETHPGVGLVVSSRRKLTAKEREHLQQAGRVEESDYSTEDDAASFTTLVKLPDHLTGVAKFARRFAAGCRLAEDLVSDIELAAALHDLGKADPRFQSWLRGGLPFPAAQQFSDMLAKSGSVSNPLARRRARERSGYPAGGRHELLSVRLAESDATILARARDPELVLHLIATHHGRCRPFAPIVEDPAPMEVPIDWNGRILRHSSETGLERLDSGVAERFWNLVRRYGWWGLAYLEAIHILADHRRSEWEQSKTEKEE